MAGIATAQTTDELLEQVKSEIKAELKAAQSENNPLAQQRSLHLQEIFSQLAQNDPGEYGNAALIRTLAEIETTAGSDKLEALCHALTKQAQAEQEKREAALGEELQAGMTEALRAGLSAKTMQDLDAPLAAIHKLMEKLPSQSITNPRLLNLINEGRRLSDFLQQWQDYLSGIYTGSDIRQTIQDLLKSSSDASALLPRSEFLARIGEIQKNGVTPDDRQTSRQRDKKLQDILVATKSLDDILPALGQMERLIKLMPDPNPGANSMVWPQMALRSIENCYLEVKNGSLTGGNATNFPSVLANQNSDSTGSIRALQIQLIFFALPRLVGLPESQDAKPGDTVPIYVLRLANNARDASDWALLARIVERARQMGAWEVFSPEDNTAFRSFLTGINQERARQYAIAVNSFETALQTSSQIISPEVIGNHLDGIRKEHPGEFEEGLRLFNSRPQR